MAEATRDTMTGVLHASVVPKCRGGLFEQLVIMNLVDAGRIELTDRRFFYAPRYYLTTVDATVKNQRPRLWSFKGQPKALSVDLRGHLVTVKATFEPWLNRIGFTLSRPQIISVSDERVADHRCDSPGTCGGVRETT